MYVPHRSLTLRITLLFAWGAIWVLLLLGLIVRYMVNQHFVELDQDLMQDRQALLQRVADTLPSPVERHTLKARLLPLINDHQGISVVLYDADQQLFLASEQTPMSLLHDGAVHQQHGHRSNRQFRSLATQLQIPGEARPWPLVIATDVAHHQHFMADFGRTFWAWIAVAALLTGLLGWGATYRGLLPLRRIRNEAERIRASNLSARLPEKRMPAELAQVTTTLNAMLARLEASFTRLSDFSSDLAHELRTPVTNMLTQTQVALSQARSSADYQDVLASNAEELERLSRMISDMLFLAKSEHQLVVPNREPVYWHLEARQAVEYFEPLIDDKALNVTISGNACVHGDRLMLRRALHNLLSNAVRHTAPHGHITITLSETRQDAKLTVANTGDAIAPEQCARLFDRFYRADASRTAIGAGAGLGLAITRSIAHAHGGEITATSENGWNRFVLTLPLAP